MATIRQVIKSLKANKLVGHDPIARENLQVVLDIRNVIQGVERIDWSKQSPSGRATVLSNLAVILSGCDKTVKEFPNPEIPRPFPKAICDALASINNYCNALMLGTSLAQLVEAFTMKRLDFGEKQKHGQPSAAQAKSSRLDTDGQIRQIVSIMEIYPTAFVSYSWDDNAHKKWVADLAAKLRGSGVDTRLDQWHAVPGDQLPAFMEREIRGNNYVIVICTPKYKEKSDSRKGGVGYEGDVMTAEVHNKNNHRKFIPVLARGSWEQSAPSWLLGKYYVDFSDPAKLNENYPDLLSTILGIRPKAPALGPAPTGFQPPMEPEREGNAGSDGIKILGVIVDEVTEPTMDGTPGSALYKVPFRLSQRPSKEWIQLFLEAWDRPPQYTGMHRPGIAQVFDDKIVLDGTTIEEVQSYHKDTLKVCVKQANEREKTWRDEAAQQKAAAQKKAENYRSNIHGIASQIRFDEE